MKSGYVVGELVHIPQAVVLLECGPAALDDPQLTIPIRVKETDAPKVGIVAETAPSNGYVRVYCEGSMWAIKNDSIYSLEGYK